MLVATATLSMLTVEDGGLTGLLADPSRSLLFEPDVRDLRERAGWDYLGVQITTSEGRGLEPGQNYLDVELLFWAEEARPWVEVGTEFHLVMPPRRVGGGRVVDVSERGAPSS